MLKNKKLMVIRLNQPVIFFLGLAIILSYFLIDRLVIIYQSNITMGIIDGYGHRSVAKFESSFGTLTVENNDKDLHHGDSVPVLYNRQSPAVAYIYTTYNFWVRYILGSLILIVPWSAFAWGYVSPNKVVEIKLPINLRQR